MNPIQFAVRSPYTVAVIVIIALLFSVLAYNRIPIQLKPTVEPPLISVRTVYRGASPVEVEQQITRPIEDLLQSVEGLQKLTSSSVEGVSSVTLEYAWGADKDTALIDVINKLSQLPDLPPDAEEPVVVLSGQPGENASMWLVAESHYSTDRVRQIIAEQVEPRLERVVGVADLMIIGGEEREIRIHIDAERLAAYNVTFSELDRALRGSHVDLRGGTVESASRQMVVRTEGRSPEIDTIGDIVIRRDKRGTVRVRDVVDVIDGYRERRSVVHGNGRHTVCIGVNRQVGANVVTMIDGVDAEVAKINRRMESQGIDLRLDAVHRDTTYLQKALDFVESNLLLGAALAVVVLLVFLRSLRSVLIVGLAIPVSLVTVFLVMDALGRSLNVISLAGLAFAAGMVVDNAIVVLENIYRHLERGKSAAQAAIDGGREVWGGVLAATLTTVAVFVPILGVQEEAGQLFADLAIAITAAVAISLVVALSVVPTLSAIMYRGQRRDRVERKPNAFSRFYGRIARRLAARGPAHTLEKLTVIVLVAAGSIACLKITPPAGYLPTGNTNLIFFIATPIPGMRPEALSSHMAELEAWIQEQPESGVFFTVIAPTFNGGGVVLKDEYGNAEGLDGYLQRMRPICANIPGYRFMLPIRTSLFRDSGKQFTVEITGPELDGIEKVADELKGALNSWPGVQPHGVRSDYIKGRPELRVEVREDLAMEAGLSVREVGAVVETALAGRIVSLFSDGGRDFDVKLVVPQERVSSRVELAELPVITPNGARTTLGALTTIERRTGPQSIQRLERERAITLTVNLQPDAVLQEVIDDVEAQLVSPQRSRLPSDYHIELGGSADKFSRTLSAMAGSFWLAILITYLLLVALFRSWFSPLIIMVSVPLAMSGGIMGITVASELSADATFDLLSMLGFVILAGVVVNNSILIIHQTNNLIDEGVQRREALTRASQSRLRPILMSVTTTVFGMLPLAIGRGAGAELYQGLAAVVVGGLIVSTLFSLVLVPALQSLLWDFQALFRSKPAPQADVSLDLVS